MNHSLQWSMRPFRECEGCLPILAPVDIPTHPTVEQVQQLEAVLRTYPPAAVRNEHFFAPGVYARMGFMPAGTVATGKRHRFEHLNFLMQGSVRITTNEGMQTLHAPAIVTSKAGTKKVACALTDCVWVTVHPTNETDLDSLEAQLTMPESAPMIGAPA